MDRRLHVEHREARSTLLGTGTLACPACDAPVWPSLPSLSPADPMGCPFCFTSGAVRDFLTLGDPARPTRVEVRVAYPPARTAS